METLNIVWNGCDNYKISTEPVFTRSEEFTPFEVVEIDITDLPKNEDGEVIFDGVFGTECGRFFLPFQKFYIAKINPEAGEYCELRTSYAEAEKDMEKHKVHELAFVDNFTFAMLHDKKLKVIDADGCVPSKLLVDYDAFFKTIISEKEFA